AARLCATTGFESTTGTAYGAAGSGGLYNEVPPGQTTLTGKIAAATDNGLALGTVSTSVDDGKYYSYFISCIYEPAGTKVDAFVVAGPIPTTIDPAQAYIRFVNAASNSQPMTLYAKSTTSGNEVAVGATVAYQAAGTFTAVPGGVYDLNTRNAGSATNV